MTVVTTRPNATIFGSGTPHSDTSDDNNATFISIGGSGAPIGALGKVLGFAEPTAPANSKYKQMAVRVRSRKSGSPAAKAGYTLSKNKTSISDGTKLVESEPSVTWASWTVHTVLTTTKSGTNNLVLTTWIRSTTAVEVAEIWLDTTYVERPEVTVDGPTGTLTDTTAPEITWSVERDTSGGFATAYEIKVFSDAQYGAGGFNPSSSTPTQFIEESSSARRHQLVEPLADDTYRAYVRVAQTVNGSLWWSAWAYTEFTILADRPDPPVDPVNPEDPGGLTATGQSDQARIQIDVETTDGDVTADFVEIQRSADNGGTWEYIRRRQSDYDYAVEIYEDDIPDDADHLFRVVDDAVRTWDYEAPNGVQALYRARTVHDYTPGYSRSDWSETDAAMWTSTSWWLKAADGSRINVRPFSLPGLTRGSRSKVSQVLGRPTVVVTSDLRGPWMGEIVLETDTVEEQDEIDVLLEKVQPLLLQAPQGLHWKDRWLSFGEQSRQWMVDKLAVEDTLETLPFVVTQSPDGFVAEAPTVAAEDAVDPEEIVLI
jgi:hypothetical protein